MSESIVINNSTINANSMIISNKVKILNGSVLNSTNNGFLSDYGVGTAKNFMSLSFSCGQNGGSHGGRGGIGAGVFRNKDSIKCYKTSLDRMIFYGLNKWAISPGSNGSYEDPDSLEQISPGVITIITRKFILDKNSKLISGYSGPDTAQNFEKEPKNLLLDRKNVRGGYSGGSILLASKIFS